VSPHCNKNPAKGFELRLTQAELPQRRVSLRSAIFSSFASAYALALLAVTRGPLFKQRSARLSGTLLLLLGLGIVGDVVRRALQGAELVGIVMLASALLSLAVNVTVLRMPSRCNVGTDSDATSEDGRPAPRCSWVSAKIPAYRR
jgi:hypothetical protein